MSRLESEIQQSVYLVSVREGRLNQALHAYFHKAVLWKIGPKQARMTAMFQTSNTVHQIM